MSNIIFISLLVAMTAVVVNCEDGGLKVEVVHAVEKCERKSKNLDRVTMHYTGFLENGTQFDSSLERNQPFEFQLGIGQVIPGLEEGLRDMCPGEKRKLTIPPYLAYGGKGAADVIPPDATLLFVVELVHTADGPVPPSVFKQVDKDGDKVLTQEEVSDYLVAQDEEHGQPTDKDSKDFKERIQAIFDHEDKDKDGVISHNEFSGPKHDEL
ncbi:uncharacterized protein LOC123526289 [Mercenaria mercenaria]|uniref:uncharacterized protein LOC123526289 n=1 Tax=Mercenaria mercenaria TaxID=6596 RepID=UPI00234EAB76|nr:uncharacterized protein LOC123526289 [Mercenaria mercenaria]